MSVTTRVTGRPVPIVPGGFFLIILRKYEAEFFHLDPSKKAVTHRCQASSKPEVQGLVQHITCCWAESRQGEESRPMLGYLECATYRTARTIKAKTTAAEAAGMTMARFGCAHQHFESSSAHRLASTPKQL